MATLFSVLIVLAAGVGSEYSAPSRGQNAGSQRLGVLRFESRGFSLSTVKTPDVRFRADSNESSGDPGAMLAVLFAGLLALGLLS